MEQYKLAHKRVGERAQNKHLKYIENVITKEDVIIIKKMTDEKADIMDIFVALRVKNPFRDTRTLFAWIERTNLGKYDYLLEGEV